MSHSTSLLNGEDRTGRVVPKSVSVREAVTSMNMGSWTPQAQSCHANGGTPCLPGQSCDDHSAIVHFLTELPDM
jgi:hypothetical protein